LDMCMSEGNGLRLPRSPLAAAPFRLMEPEDVPI
jgi:hypothetical protein